MIRINQIKLELTDDEDKLLNKIAKQLKVNPNRIKKVDIVKKSIDARHKPDIKYVYSVNVTVDEESKIEKKIFNNNIFITDVSEYKIPVFGNQKLKNRPVIVGMGPAGLFCGYFLAKYGYKPLIIERGESVDKRMKTVNDFFESGKLNIESNIQFGEGGAGTFSDGKLNTLVKDKDGRNKKVLETFVEFGAAKDIVYTNKPHIGTDVLSKIVKNMREEIVNLGGEVRFNCKLTDIIQENNEINAIILNGDEKIECNALVLAIGHSARDTFEMLYNKNINMEAKSFAVGVRIEHPQGMINKNMYGVSKHEILEAADYKVTYNNKEGRGVYSFCMCPGGYVVNASSEEGMLAVNGMSYSKRDGKNANSAIVVTVNPDDFNGKTPLAGIEFQRNLEKNAYKEGNGKIPVQLFGDFMKNQPTTQLKEIQPSIKGMYTLCNIRNIFPDYISNSIIEGVHGFSRQIKDFDRNDAVLSGVESRTSSPLRILRDDKMESCYKGIYPAGEGAGYAGGITSAAMDGIRIFEAISKKYSPLRSE